MISGSGFLGLFWTERREHDTLQGRNELIQCFEREYDIQ